MARSHGENPPPLRPPPRRRAAAAAPHRRGAAGRAAPRHRARPGRDAVSGRRLSCARRRGSRSGRRHRPPRGAGGRRCHRVRPRLVRGDAAIVAAVPGPRGAGPCGPRQVFLRAGARSLPPDDHRGAAPGAGFRPRRTGAGAPLARPRAAGAERGRVGRRQGRIRGGLRRGGGVDRAGRRQPGLFCVDRPGRHVARTQARGAARRRRGRARGGRALLRAGRCRDRPVRAAGGGASPPCARRACPTSS